MKTTSKQYVATWMAGPAWYSQNSLQSGEHITKKALELDLGYAMGFMLLSDIYHCHAGNWDHSGDVKQQQEE